MVWRYTARASSWLFVFNVLSGCAPSLYTSSMLNSFQWAYPGATRVNGTISQSLGLTPSFVFTGGTGISITGCQIQPGSPYASLFPSELSVNPITCIISGTPKSVLNPTLFTVQATNSLGGTAITQLTLSIGVPSSNWGSSTFVGSDISYFYGIAVDPSGNSYAAGYVGGGITRFGNNVMTSGAYAGYNAGLVKYDTTGLAQWAVTLNSSSSDSRFTSIAIDANGNSYVVGRLSGSSLFDFGNAVTVSAAYGSGQNAFIVKYNPLGIAQWAATTTTASLDSYFNGVAVDGLGNVYAVGYLNHNSSFGFGNGVTVSGGNGSYRNIVIVKYNSSGLAQWAKSTTTVGADSNLLNVALDSAGNVYAAGVIDKNATFNFGNGVIVGPNSFGALLIKYNSSGSPQWATATSATDVILDSTDNIYVAGGLFSNSVYSFGNGVTATGAYSGANNNAAVVKYNSAGLAQWAQTTTVAANYSWYNGLAADANGNIFAVGYLNGGPIDFGNQVTVVSSGLLLVKYNSAGLAQGASSITSGSFSSQYSAVGVDSAGNAYAAGRFDQAIGMPTTTLSNGVTYSGGAADLDTSGLVVKYGY